MATYNNRPRHVPLGYAPFSPDMGDYPKNMVTFYIKLSDFSAICYKGKSAKKLWWYKFSTEERMLEKIKETTFDAMERHERTEKYKTEERKELESIQVGTILAYSWGYDQTNVDFFQVVAKGKKQFKMRAIASCSVSHDTSMSGSVRALPDVFVDEKIHIKNSLSMPFGLLRVTTKEEKHYFSSWA